MNPDPVTPSSLRSASDAPTDVSLRGVAPRSTPSNVRDDGSSGKSRTPSDRPPETSGVAEDEAALVARLCGGDPAAFEQLVRTYGPRLLKLARRYLPSESDAEDTVQDAFLSAFRAIGDFAGDSRIGTWLHRITVNAALMRIRARSRRPESFIDDVQHDFGQELRAHVVFDSATEEHLDSVEFKEVVRAAIDRLDENSRIVVRLRDIERIELREISLLLGVGLPTVKSRLRRGRLALRVSLASHFRATSP
jgi:RNA polymerase sigma-70 factor, ECF subfamily